AQECPHVYDIFYRLAEHVGVEPPVSTSQPYAVDRPDERGQVVVGTSVAVVLVGLEPVGPVGGGGDLVVLPPAVVAVGTSAVFQGRASDVAAVGLVEVSAVIVAAMMRQETIIDMLAQG